MAKKYLVISALAALLTGIPAIAQSPADLLQRGIHAQETVGDIDGAIRIFRQVASSNSKQYAAQAQYQLVLCMLQKGDRPAATREFQLLARNFADQPDLVSKAGKLLPGSAELLPAPWGEREGMQLNIKRDGITTGEYLYYSVQPDSGDKANPQAQSMKWEFKTKKSTRFVVFKLDRDTMRPLAEPNLWSDDNLGEPALPLISGPAVDIEGSVFLMRRLPLAVGYKKTISSLPFVIGQTAARQLELVVTGIEAVRTPAGKFNCFTISLAGIGQTFWIGVDARRPLVKFQSGKVEAELVKVWGAEDTLESVLEFVTATGGTVQSRYTNHAESTASAGWRDSPQIYFSVWLRNVYTPTAEIATTLRQAIGERTGDHVKVRPESIQTMQIQGRQALSCIADLPKGEVYYYLWIRTENTFAQFSTMIGAAFDEKRFNFDRRLSQAQIP